jgi:hypothetical protein
VSAADRCPARSGLAQAIGISEREHSSVSALAIRRAGRAGSSRNPRAQSTTSLPPLGSNFRTLQWKRPNDRDWIVVMELSVPRSMQLVLEGDYA